MTRGVFLNKIIYFAFIPLLCLTLHQRLLHKAATGSKAMTVSGERQRVYLLSWQQWQFLIFKQKSCVAACIRVQFCKTKFMWRRSDWGKKNATSCNVIRTQELQNEAPTHTHYYPSLFSLSIRGITEWFSMWGIFFRWTDKALPVRSLLAATSHAAQGGSPASYSILPSALPPQYCSLWMAMTAGNIQTLCICSCTHILL